MAEEIKGPNEAAPEWLKEPEGSSGDQVESAPTPDIEAGEPGEDEPKASSEIFGEALLEAMADMDGTSEIEMAAGLSESKEDGEGEKKPRFGAFELTDSELGVDMVLVDHIEESDPLGESHRDDMAKFRQLMVCERSDMDEYMTPSVASLVVEMFMSRKFEECSLSRLIDLFNALPLAEQEKIACSDVAPALYGHVIRNMRACDYCFTSKLCAGMTKTAEDPQKATVLAQLFGDDGEEGTSQFVVDVINDLHENISSKNRRKMFETDLRRETSSRLSLATAFLDSDELLKQVKMIMGNDEEKRKMNVREVVQLFTYRSGVGVWDTNRFIEVHDLEREFEGSNIFELISFLDRLSFSRSMIGRYYDADEKRCKEVLDLVDRARSLLHDIGGGGIMSSWTQKHLFGGLLFSEKGETLVREALKKGELDDEMKVLLKNYLNRFRMMDKKYGPFIHSLEDLRDKDKLKIQRVHALEKEGATHDAKLELCEYAYHASFGALVREFVTLGILEFTAEDRDDMQRFGGTNPEGYYGQEGRFKIRIKNLTEYRKKAKLSDEEYALLLDALALVSASEETISSVIDACEQNHPNNTRRLGEALFNIRQRRRRELSKSYTKTMQESLATSVTEVEGEKIEYEGKPIQLLKVTGEHFRLLVHLLGAFSEKDLDQPSRWDQYVQPSRDAKGKPVGYISTCTLSEGALFVAQTEPLGAGDEVYYGFADLGEDGFLYGAEYDTYTETTEGADKSARVVTERQAFLYDDMDELIERTKTRRKSDEDYNEVVLDRYARNRPEPAQELLYPSYVIVFTDDPKKITERSKKHAAYFGVPILMIDPVKYGSKS